jgi:trimethylamine:corrinoid methyltransferase-like protein
MPQVCVWNEGEGEYIYRHVKDADLPEITRLYDALATVDLIFPPTIALETAKQGLPAHIHELFATLSETTKHVNLTNAAPRSLDEWDYYVRLAAEVVGGEEELRRKPIISGKSLFTPPLRLSKPACFNLLGAAKYGLPLMIGGCNTPLTILNACNTVVNHASVVANLAFAQMLRPKMPCVVDVSGDSLHLIHITTNKTAPENLLLNAALIQMAHDHLGLPVCNGPYQSAKITDIQASFEASVATCSLWMLGCDFWVNYTFNDYAFNVEMLVFYDELARYFDHLGKRFIDTIPTDENVAFGAIKEVGPLADYLTHSITLKNANLQYKPELADYRDFTKWKKDKKNMLDRIREKVRILEMHRAPTLPGDVSRRMLMIVNEADRKLSRN